MSQTRETDHLREEIYEEGTTPAGRERLLTVPNILCFIRLFGSIFVVGLAWYDYPHWCLGLIGVLLVTDWVDGKLAVLLRQQTTFGARLDTVADVTFYASVLAAVGILRWELVVDEMIWIAPAVGTYALSVVAALVKYHRFPSYHTRMAKISWGLITIAIIAVFTDWSVWPLRIAMAGVLLTNLEATVITMVSPVWRADVPSLYHALQADRH
jgi:CDP-diacylglycerol--glycerol-3-phosphate 3-phosphatidyltransferase